MKNDQEVQLHFYGELICKRPHATLVIREEDYELREACRGVEIYNYRNTYTPNYMMALLPLAMILGMMLFFGLQFLAIYIKYEFMM